MFGLVELGLVSDPGRQNHTLVHQPPEQMAQHRVLFDDDDV